MYLLPYGPSLHYPFVEQNPLGQNQNRGNRYSFDLLQCHLINKKKKNSPINMSCNSLAEYEGHNHSLSQFIVCVGFIH